jgi:outer membrane protein OmpA-like peptidoglycan-associated protein
MLKSLLAVAAAMSLLAACAQPAQPDAAPGVQRATPPVEMPPTTVYFDSGRSTLSEEAKGLIGQVADSQKSTAGATLSLTGHADTVGSRSYNTVLAERRVESVRAALVLLGVPSAAITSSAHGEVTLPVRTGDAADEPLNRSVDIAMLVPGKPVHMTNAQYCAALGARYREYRTAQIDQEAAGAIANCEAGDTAAGIPVLERHLKTAKIELPLRY